MISLRSAAVFLGLSDMFHTQASLNEDRECAFYGGVTLSGVAAEADESERPRFNSSLLFYARLPSVVPYPPGLFAVLLVIGSRRLMHLLSDLCANLLYRRAER